MRRIIGFMVAVASLSAESCRITTNSDGEFTLHATVRLVEVDGGCWTVRDQRGTTWELLGLPTNFQEDGLPVVVTLRPRTDVGSFCLVGRVATILRIERGPR